MADIIKLKTLIDSYGVGVRAGVITPQFEDEVYFRRQMGIPAMSDAAMADWQSTRGVRKPLTLKGNEEP